MDASLERLKTKIEKLTAQQRQIEERYTDAVAHLVKELTQQKGVDLPILTGMILNANDIITEFSSKKEGWQIAGEKFLLRSKNKYSRSKPPHRKRGTSKA
jgi:hypothetical protein